MKLTNPFRLSYCAFILLFGNVCASANSQDAPSTPDILDWKEPKGPSNLLKWTVDPEHAWWQKALHKREDNPPTETGLPLPTKCQYIPANTDKPCSNGCICSTQCTGMFIWNLTHPEPRPQYHICTNWNLNHGNQLKAGFREIGFSMVPNRTRCGWQKFERVSAMRVGRGDINVNGTVAQPFGDALELARIEKVMKQEYPFVEIMIICATLLGPIFLLFCFTGWFIWAKQDRKVKVRYHKVPKA